MKHDPFWKFNFVLQKMYSLNLNNFIVYCKNFFKQTISFKKKKKFTTKTHKWLMKLVCLEQFFFKKIYIENEYVFSKRIFILFLYKIYYIKKKLQTTCPTVN